MALLTAQRRELLNKVHVEEKKINCEDMGIFTAFDKQNKSVEKLDELMKLGKSL